MPPSAAGIAAALRALASDPSGAADEIWSSAGSQGLRARKDQTLYFEDDPADAVYLLLEGHLVAFNTPDDQLGLEQATLLLAAPSIVGDREVIAGIRCQETVACLSTCRVLAWPAAQFLEAWSQPEVRALAAGDLATRYASQMQMGWVQRLEISRRLHFVLAAILASGLGAAAVETALLAKLVRANPKTVQRGLRSLRAAGILSPSGFELQAPPLPELALPLIHRLTV